MIQQRFSRRWLKAIFDELFKEYEQDCDDNHMIVGADGSLNAIDDDVIRDLVTGRFLRCIIPVMTWMKQGETYWLEYVSDGLYNVRSDNALGKQFQMNVRQLFTSFVPVEYESDVYKLMTYFFLLGNLRIDSAFIQNIIEYYKTVGLVDGSKTSN